MVHPYANPAGYMSASRDTISSQSYGPKRGEDCRPPRRKRFSALSFMNMRNSKDLSSPGARLSPTTTVLSSTSTIVAPSPAHSRAPSVSRSRAPSVSHSRAPSAPPTIASPPPSIVRKPSSGSRRGRDPPFIVKSSQHCTFEVALPAKTRDDGVHSRTARSVPRVTARYEHSRTGSSYERSAMRQDQAMMARSLAPRIARVPPPSITQVPPPSVTRVPSTTRPSPPSTARSSPPSTARSSPPSTARPATLYGSPSTAHSSPTLVSTPINAANHANASSPNLVVHATGNDSTVFVQDNVSTSHRVANVSTSHRVASVSTSHRVANAHAYPDDTWSFFTPPTPAVPRFSFNWHGKPGRRGRMRIYGAQVKHYGVRVRHYGVRVKHSMNGTCAKQMKGYVATTYGKTKAKGRQIATRAKEASQFMKQVALAVKQEMRGTWSSTTER